MKSEGKTIGSSLALQITEAVYGVEFGELGASTLDHVKTLLIDAVACIYAAPEALVDEARAIAGPANHAGAETASVLTTGERTGAAAAAAINGALLRSRDLMDVFAGADVCHPSEAVPPLLAAAEHVDASGRALLETTAAAFSLHVLLSQSMPMHPYGFHHTGHAAIVAPVAIGRMLGLAPAQSAAALNLASVGALVPEGFSRGQVTNLKTYAYGLHARNAFEAIRMSTAGLLGADRMLDEIVSVWTSISRQDISTGRLTGRLDTEVLEQIWLKQYPAQYALQPLIGAAIELHHRIADRLGSIEAVTIRASRRTIERCADEAKYVPSSAEAADHSLPFCFAAGLVDGAFDLTALQCERWLDRDVSQVMALIRTEAYDEDLGYSVGPQEVAVRLASGETLSCTPSYPASGLNWRDTATEKLKRYGSDRLDVPLVVQTIEQLEYEPSVRAAVGKMLKSDCSTQSGKLRSGSPRPAGRPACAPGARSAQADVHRGSRRRSDP